MTFSIKDFFCNVTKSAVYGFKKICAIKKEIPNEKLHFLCSVCSLNIAWKEVVIC